jgi:hypothetical protein
MGHEKEGRILQQIDGRNNRTRIKWVGMQQEREGRGEGPDQHLAGLKM